MAGRRSGLRRRREAARGDPHASHSRRGARSAGL